MKMKISKFITFLVAFGIASVGFAQQPYSAPSTAFNPFYVSNARVDSAFNNVPNVITLTAARTLLARESGSIVQFNAAAGFTITLPVPTAGLYYDFTILTTNTSSNHKIITDAGTTFIAGATQIFGATAATFACNGTTHIAILMNGTTTGGVIGTWIRVIAMDATHWVVTGLIVGSGTAATACSTS